MSTRVLIILALSGVWLLIMGQINLRQWLAGLIFSTLFVLLTGWGKGSRSSLLKIPVQLAYFFLFVLLLIVQLTVANFQMAHRLLRRTPVVNSGIVKIPAGDLTDPALGIEEQAITVIPGELVVDYSDDERMIYVHTIDVSSYQGGEIASISKIYRSLKRIFG